MEQVEDIEHLCFESSDVVPHALAAVLRALPTARSSEQRMADMLHSISRRYPARALSERIDGNISAREIAHLENKLSPHISLCDARAARSDSEPMGPVAKSRLHLLRTTLPPARTMTIRQAL